MEETDAYYIGQGYITITPLKIDICDWELLKELEEDIEPIDDLVAFTESDTAVRLFGEERAKQFAVHARELKASGAKYCDCPACAACAAILEKKGELL